jgi:hypothetical protein
MRSLLAEEVEGRKSLRRGKQFVSAETSKPSRLTDARCRSARQSARDNWGGNDMPLFMASIRFRRIHKSGG